MSELDEATQRLIDESDLRDLIHRYAFGLDHQDWELWRSVFTDNVHFDMSDFSGVASPDPVPVEAPIKAMTRMFAQFDCTQHFMGSHRYDIRGDEATITAHMRAEHWLTNTHGGDKYTMFGTYTDECVRTDDGWKVHSVTLRMMRQEGNRHVMDLATKRGREAAQAEKEAKASNEGNPST